MQIHCAAAARAEGGTRSLEDKLGERHSLYSTHKVAGGSIYDILYCPDPS